MIPNLTLRILELVSQNSSTLRVMGELRTSRFVLEKIGDICNRGNLIILQFALAQLNQTTQIPNLERHQALKIIHIP